MDRSTPVVNTALATPGPQGSPSRRNSDAHANYTDDVNDDAIAAAEEHPDDNSPEQLLQDHTTTNYDDALAGAGPAPINSDASRAIAAGHRHSESSDDMPRSLVDLPNWPFFTTNFDNSIAAQVPLPASTKSSLITANSVSKASSLAENRPEEPKPALKHDRVHEKKKSRWGTIRNMLEAKARLKSINKEKQEREDLFSRHKSEPQIYHENVALLAEAHPNLKVVATTMVRHQWHSRILYYDYMDKAEDVTTHEPWSGYTDAPDFLDFYGTLRDVPDNCSQRVILVEDLNPSLIDFLGVTFEIPPQVFEEHLKQSGYSASLESDNDESWHMASSDQGYMSISWYRPVLPTIPVTPLLRKKLTSGDQPQIRRNRRTVHLNTTTNIWRSTLGLCPAPGVYHKGSKPEYPVGWEEKVTIWAREIKTCKVGTCFRKHNLTPSNTTDEASGGTHGSPTCPDRGATYQHCCDHERSAEGTFATRSSPYSQIEAADFRKEHSGHI